MEDGRGQQGANLNPSSSSWSAAAAPQEMRSGCDWEGGLLNLHDPVLMNMHSSLYNMGGGGGGGALEMYPSSHSDMGMQVGGRSRRKKTVVRDIDGCKKNNNGQVIHVRAKRGQATDSHSLAERVRREKINDKLKALQRLVPGCYKTMGMAVMLDVIITYVQSLQNQIEFLSMKLSAASMFYDFNSPEAEAMEAFQRTNGSNPCEEEEEEARDMEKVMMMRDDDNQGFDPLHLPSFSAASAASAADHHARHLHSTWPF